MILYEYNGDIKTNISVIREKPNSFHVKMRKKQNLTKRN